MRVVQQIFADQVFIISALRFLLQYPESFIGFHMQERFSVVIQPAVQRLQSKDQPLRIAAEIRFPVFEFKIIQPCPQRLPVNARLCLFFQYVFNHADKLFLLILFRSFCHDGKIRLHHPIVIGAVYFLPDPLPDQRLFQRSARRGAEGIVQYLKGDI